jgi:hypothetical protein
MNTATCGKASSFWTILVSCFLLLIRALSSSVSCSEVWRPPGLTGPFLYVHIRLNKYKSIIHSRYNSRHRLISYRIASSAKHRKTTEHILRRPPLGRMIRKLQKVGNAGHGLLGEKTGGVWCSGATNLAYGLYILWTFGQREDSCLFSRNPPLVFLISIYSALEGQKLDFGQHHTAYTTNLQFKTQQQWHSKNSPTTQPYVCSTQQAKANTAS